MSRAALDIGVVTDEVSRDLAEALAVSRSWGLSQFELREGCEQRFPFFTDAEVRWVEDALRDGAAITAVSPGILKGHVDEERKLRRELDEVLPQAIEMAVRFECPVLVVFGFARYEGEPASNRTKAMQAFAHVAERAAEAGLTVAVENEPNFWIDRPEAAAAMLDEIGHPALKINWDPANQHWGGQRPERVDFEALRPHIANVHAKDYTPDDPDVPWRPIGDGITPWDKILRWIIQDTDLAHITLETHCQPLIENSRTSLTALRDLIAAAAESNAPS